MPRRLTLVIPTLSRGGAERTLAGMANHWADAGDSVTLITLADDEAGAYPLDHRVEHVALDVLQTSAHVVDAVRNNSRRLGRLRQAIGAARPDAVISFIDTTNVAVLMATRGLNVPVVVSERIDPRRHNIGRAWSWLRRRAYPQCAGLVVQTEAVLNAARKLAGGRPVHVIPNAAPDWDMAKCQPEDRQPTIIGMGRLTPQKGFDLLIGAFARIADRHPDWRVRIFGAGQQRDSLQDLADREGLADRVELPGAVEAPQGELLRAGLFVLSSRFEGFPNVLLEAMTCQAPCIAFDCDSGPAEIVRHGVDGLLVPAGDVEALAESMHGLIADSDQRGRLAANAGDVQQRFSREKFFTRWEAVLGKLLGK